MKTICLKFPDKTTAHSLLYEIVEGELVPRYQNIADHSKTGLCVQRVTTEEGEYFIHPDDGAYCADIRDNRYPEECPAELQPYLIHPDLQYRRHKFAGE